MTGKPKLRKRSAEPVVVKVDAALKRAWHDAVTRLRAADREGAFAFDRKYEAVGEILEHDPPLYLAGGVSNVGDFVAKYLANEDVRSVLRNVRVAKYASPDEEEKYGASKLDAAIDYVEQVAGHASKGRVPVDFGKLHVRVDDGRSVPFADATVQQVRDATKKHAAAGAKRAKRSPVVSEILAHVPKTAKEVTVHYADGHVTVGRVPVRLFGDVMRSLAKAKVPTP